MGPTGALPRIKGTQWRQGEGDYGNMETVKAMPALLATLLHILIIQRKRAIQN